MHEYLLQGVNGVTFTCACNAHRFSQAPGCHPPRISWTRCPEPVLLQSCDETDERHKNPNLACRVRLGVRPRPCKSFAKVSGALQTIFACTSQALGFPRSRHRWNLGHRKRPQVAEDCNRSRLAMRCFDGAIPPLRSSQPDKHVA